MKTSLYFILCVVQIFCQNYGQGGFQQNQSPDQKNNLQSLAKDTGTPDLTAQKPVGQAPMQQNMLLRTALNQVTADSLNSSNSKAFLPTNGQNSNSNGCDEQSVDGNWQVVSNEMRRDCIEKQNKKTEKAYELARKLTQPKQEDCKIKISKQSMVCHAKKVMDDVISAPYYTINMYGNVVEMIVDGKVVMMGIAETLTYDVEEKTNEKPNFFKEPTATFKFNQLGGLLSQKGEVPSPKKDDPCASCLENLSKKGNSVDGKPNNCNGCESMMDITSIRPGSFRMSQNKQDGKEKKTITTGEPNQ